MLAITLHAWPVMAAEVNFKVVDNVGGPLANVVVAAGEENSATPVGQAIMDQRNKRFAPYVLPVGKGASVSFPNSDQIRHHVYSFSPTHPFEIKLYHGEPSEPIKLEQTGTVVLGCNIHDNMIGYIFVTSRPAYDSSDAEGMVTLEVGNIGEKIDVWHPALSLDAQKQLEFDLSSLKRENGIYVVELPIEAQPEHPQAVLPTARDRFRRYIQN